MRPPQTNESLLVVGRICDRQNRQGPHGMKPKRGIPARVAQRSPVSRSRAEVASVSPSRHGVATWARGRRVTTRSPPSGQRRPAAIRQGMELACCGGTFKVDLAVSSFLPLTPNILQRPFQGRVGIVGGIRFHGEPATVACLLQRLETGAVPGNRRRSHRPTHRNGTAGQTVGWGNPFPRYHPRYAPSRPSRLSWPVGPTAAKNATVTRTRALSGQHGGFRPPALTSGKQPGLPCRHD